MAKSDDTIYTAEDLYAIFWRLVHLSVHRYGSHPTGELLIVLTMILLDQAGARPTVSDLAEITGLPKSSVSRYVSSEISDGFLAEIIDPADRRRRMLMITDKARAERRWHASQLETIGHAGRDALAGLGNTGDPPTDMMNALKAATLAARPDNSKL